MPSVDVECRVCREEVSVPGEYVRCVTPFGVDTEMVPDPGVPCPTCGFDWDDDAADDVQFCASPDCWSTVHRLEPKGLCKWCRDEAEVADLKKRAR